MSRTVLCYGDSNTYGYDPRSFLGDRYAKDIRWTGILDGTSDWSVTCCGQNGREIPTQPRQWEQARELLRQAVPDGETRRRLLAVLAADCMEAGRPLTEEELHQRLADAERGEPL